MGCNSAKVPVIEPEQIPSLRRLSNQSQLKDIQKKIQKHLDSQQSNSRSNASTPNDVIHSQKNKSSRAFRQEMTLSTIVQKTDISTIPLQRNSVY